MKTPISPRHPAGKKRPQMYQRWSCLLCGLDGLGGVHGWTAHYTAHHYTSGETP
jgi:hypothetical protein